MSFYAIWKMTQKGSVPENHKQKLPETKHLEFSPDDPLIEPTEGTHICLWFCAIVCILLIIATIIAGFLVLILFLVFRPKNPHVTVDEARLVSLQLNPTTQLLDLQLWLMLRFKNPSKGTDLEFQYLKFELYYESDLLVIQMMLPFVVDKRQYEIKPLGMTVVDRVLSPRSVQAMTNEYMINKTFEFRMIANIKTVARMGSLVKIPHWVSSECRLSMASPPNGTLLPPSCGG